MNLYDSDSGSLFPVVLLFFFLAVNGLLYSVEIYLQEKRIYQEVEISHQKDVLHFLIKKEIEQNYLEHHDRVWKKYSFLDCRVDITSRTRGDKHYIDYKIWFPNEVVSSAEFVYESKTKKFLSWQEYPR